MEHLFEVSSFWLSRYWNDQEVLQKLGEAMGLAASGEGSVEQTVPDEAEEEAANEESIVHHTASMGDVEVQLLFHDYPY